MAGIFEQLEKQNNGRMTPASLRRDVQQRFKNAPFKYNYDQSMYDQIQQEELNKDNDTVGNGAVGHFIDSAQAGAASMAGGVLRFGSEYSPVGQDALNAGADYFDDIVRRNTPTQELSGLDYVAAAAGNALGSGGASMAMGYALLGIAGAVGLGGTAVAAIGTAATKIPKLAAAANFLSKIPMTKNVASAVSKINGSKLSMMLASQIAGSPMEAMSEGGNLIQQMRQEGYSDDEIAAAGLKSFGMNTVWLTLMNSLEGATIEKLATKLASKEGVKVGAKEIAKRAGIGAITKAAGEGPEEFGQNVIGNLAEGVPINWEEAKEAGIQGAVGAAVLGGVGGPIAPYLAKQNKAQQKATADAPAPVPTAAEQPKVNTSKIAPADARIFLEGYRDSESKGAEYAEIDDILESGDEAAIVKKAAELGFGQTQATPTTQEPPKPVESPSPAALVEQPVEAPTTPPVETPAPVTTPTATPPAETPVAPATSEATPWNGEKIKIGNAELSPVVSDDGEKIIFKSNKALTRADKQAMKANGFVWDGNRQAYAGPNTPEGRKWLGNYTVAGTQTLETRQEELGDYKLNSRKGELKDSARYVSKTNPENSIEITRMSEGSYHVDFYRGKKPIKDSRIFKTLAKAEQFVANYKDETVKSKEPAKPATPTVKPAEQVKPATPPAAPATPTKTEPPVKEKPPVEDKQPIKDEAHIKAEAPSDTNGGKKPSSGNELPVVDLERENAFYKQKFNEEVGKYAVDEFDENTNNVHNYLHSDDDGGTGSRWLAIEKKNGKFEVTMGYVGGSAEKTANFATLDEAEQYVKDNDLPPKAKEVKDNGGKENTDKDNGDKDKDVNPEPEQIKTTEADDDTGKRENGKAEGLEDNTPPPQDDTPPKPTTPVVDDAEPDGNGIIPLVKGMGVEAKNERIAKNDEALIALAEKTKKEYEDGILPAKGARELISTYVSLYNKGGNLKPVSKDALNKLAEIRKSITALEKEKANAPKLEAKKATEDAIAAGEQLVKEACDRIIADEKKPLDEDVWMEATKTTNEKLEAAGLKPLSKTKQQDLERKYRMMLEEARKESIKVNNQYHDIRSMFDAEAKNIYNSVRAGKLDAKKGLEQYNKLKEKFEADIKAINRKADRYVRNDVYDRTEKFLNEMLDPKSALPHYLNLERAFEKAENWFRDAIRYVDPKDFARPWLDTEGQRKIKEYEKLYQDAYDEYKKAVDGLGTEYNEKAAKLYQKAKDSWNAIVDRRYPADYIRYLANVVEYDDKATAIIEDYRNKNIGSKEAMAQLEKLNADFADTFNKVTGKESYFKNFFAENMKAYYTEGNFDYASQKNVDALKAAIEERGDNLAPTNPTSLEGNNFGEYTDSIMGAGTIEAIFGGTNVVKERVAETPNPKDQAIVDAMVEEKVTDDAGGKDPIEGDNIISKIDNIIAAKKDSRTTDYFRKHYDVKLEIKECLEKGVAGLYYTKYVSKKDGKAQYEYFYKLVGDDKRRPMKAVAIRVLAELAGNADGPMKITELNKKEDNAQQKEKYLKELPSDEDSFDKFDEWLYEWYGDDENLDIGSIMDILQAEYTKDNPCPLNSKFRQKHATVVEELWDGDWTFKSLGDFVRKATLINKAYGELNEQYAFIFDGETLAGLSEAEKDAIKKYSDWWDDELGENPEQYPIESRVEEEIVEEDIISDEALNKKIKNEEEQHEEDFHEKTADEADAEAEANLDKAEEYAKKFATADALDKAKAKQKQKIAKAEKEGKRVNEEAAVSEEEAARIKAAEEEALAALNVAADEINALYKADSNEQVPLENFKSSIIKQIVHAGYIVMKNAGRKIYKDWRTSMEKLVDSMKGLKEQGKAYAKRILDSAWDFITNLPENVSFATDKLKDTLDNIGMALDIALAGNDRGFGQKETEAMLQANNQPLYNRVKDYLASAFKALVRYPRRGIDNHGGGDNVDVRTTEQPATGDSGRRNGNGLEANTGNTGRGSQMGSGTATDGQTSSEVQVYGTAGDNTEKVGSPVPRGGAAAGGEQGNLQGGKAEPNDKTGLPRDTNESGSDRIGNGRGSKLPTKRTKNNRNVVGAHAGAQGSDVAPKTISQLRQQFNKSPFKPADEKGIAEAVPNLLPEQIQDEVAIERRLWTNNGKGMLVANGTGTGKTVVGLAQVVRCIQKGAKKILIVVPNSTVKDRWVDDAQLVGLPKDVFATITSGEVVDDKINFVSYKSFSDNKNILDQSWDFVIMDEAHTVSGGQDNADYIGFRTQNAQTLRAITGHERTGFDDYMWSKYRDKYNRLYGKDGLVEAEAQAFEDLNTSLNSPTAGQDLINENRAKHAQLKKELDALTREIEVLKDKELPKYEKRLLARKEDTRVLLLSATPFAYGNNIYYAEGLLFNYEKDYNDFMVEKLGYVLQDDNNTVDIRRNMDKSPNPDHDAEVRFHDELIKSGAMINRRLEVPQDYNRRFVKVNGGIGQEIDAGFDYINEKYSDSGLNKAFVDHFKYASLCRLLEAIKAEAAIPMIREYIKQGKKVVLFHDYIKDVKIPHPFILSNTELSNLSDEARAAYKKFREEDEEGKRLQALPFNGAKLADKIIEEAFGSRAVIVNGDVTPSKRKVRVDAFNNADSGVNVVSVSTAAGKEGISLHDKTKDGEGNSLRSVPRVLINIGMPTKPTDAIQSEGRIYRLGQQTNAMFRYLYTDTYTERQAYTKYISTRTSTVEHLALGSQARNLEATFSYGYLESLGYETNFNAAQDTMDTGGKALDNMSDEEVNATLKKMRKALSGKKGMTETLAKLDKQIQDLDDRINEQKRSEIITPENEAKTVNAIKNAVNGGKVTKNRDGVYVVALPNGMNLWFDLNESQVAILSRMSDEQKKRMMSAHDIRNSGYVIRGAYTQKYMPQYDGVMSLVKLTEAATQHTVDHEVYHFVQKMLLSPSELAKVMDYWKYILKKDIGADAYNQLSEKEILDRCLEMDADMHANFMAYERKPKNFIERVAWKVTKWLASFANKFGIDTPAGMYLRTASGEMFRRRDNLTSDEIAQRIRDVGIKPTKMAKALYQTAWHGTGAIFDQFDNTFNSSGVGDNVHGWGMYFARDERVSRGYRRALTHGKSERPKALERKKITYAGQEVIADYRENYDGELAWEFEKDGDFLFGLDTSDNPEFIALKSLADEDWNYKKAIDGLTSMLEAAEDRVKMAEDPEYADDKHVQRMLKGFKSEVRTFSQAIEQLRQMEQSAAIEDMDPSDGMLLNVDVPEDDVLLKEYAKIDDQPEAVKKALENFKFPDSERLEVTNIKDVVRNNPVLSAIQKSTKNIDKFDLIEEINKAATDASRRIFFDRYPAQILSEQIAHWLALRLKSKFRRAVASEGTAMQSTGRDVFDYLVSRYNSYTRLSDDPSISEDFFENENTDNIDAFLSGFVGVKSFKEYMQGILDAAKSMTVEKVSGDNMYNKAVRENMTGKQIYWGLEEQLGSPKEASLFLLDNGVQGIKYHGRRDDMCFVIFDSGNTVKIVERFDLALQNNKDLIERSYKECEDEMRKAFPNGKFTQIDANRWLVELKGGARYMVDIKDRIIVNDAEEAKARKDHGLQGKKGEVAVTGKYQGITEDIIDGVISLSRKSTQGTGYHEVYHAAWDAVLNDKEKAALLKEYTEQAKAEGRNVQEVIADAVMNNTLKRQANDSNILGRVKQRVLDFAYALKALFTRMENVHNVMRKIEQGEVWSRTPNEMQQASPRYQAAGVKAKTANLDKLSVAEKMEKQGKSREEIFDATGWWRAEDGKWRFEIKDDIDKIDARYFKKASRVPLNKLYHNEELYKAYPKLNGVRVEFIKNKDKSHFGHFSEAEQTIYINLLGREPNELTLFHELQHVIQRLEGHGNGAGTEMAKGIAVANELMAIEDMANGDIAVLQAFRTSVIMPFVDPRKASKAYATSEKYQKALTPQQEALFNKMMDKADEVDAKSQEFSDWQYYADYAGEREARQAAYRGEPDGLWYPWDSLDELETGSPIISFGKELDWIENSRATALNSQEQPDGTMLFSITPMDEVDGRGMPDDLKNVTNAPESVGESVDSTATKKDLDKLLVAKMMKGQGKTSEEIFEKTGWWRDKNGNWSLTKPKDSGEKEKSSKDTKKPYNWQKPNLDKATETGDDNTEPTPEAAQEPKQYKNVDEVMEDAQKNADDAKTTGEIRVKDTSMTPREKNKTVGFFDSLIGSPSELAKKYPVFRSFYRIYQKAEEVQEKLRGRWRKQFQSAVALLTSNDEMDSALDLLLDGELNAKEFTAQELKAMGYVVKTKDGEELNNVAKAYLHIRQLIRNIWEAVNDAHRGVTVRIDKLSGKSIKELKEKPFEENIMVRESSDATFVPLEKVELKDDVEYEVKHSRPHVYRSQQDLTKEQLDALRNSPYANVSNVEEHKVKGVDAVMYRANIERVAAPIGKITGYLPHIFEQWLVMVNTDEGPQIVGSGQSLDLALQEAKRLKGKTKGNVDFYIAPKIFDPSGVYDGDVADGKKGNPDITLSAQEFAKLEKSLRDTFNLSMAEAEEALGKVAKRESRSRFLGNLRYRKGRVGYNSDVINTLDRYISMTSRYVALQPAKRRAVNLFERTFGPMDKDYSGKDSMAVTVRRYMRYCNGTPNFLESWITNQLNKMDWWRKHVSSQYGDRTLMALAGKANGLLSMSLLGCFNISSAVVGLTQLINTYGLIGGRYLGEGMAAVQRMNLRDKRILTEAGIPYNIGLDTPSGFTKRREGIDSANAFGNMRRMLSYAGNKGMYFFKQADRLTRNATTLGAYYKAIADGKTHKQAIEYAKDINRRANFSYGAADAAGLFQWTAGTGFGELSLLFQKYPMKEWELMKSMMPIIGSSTKAEKARFWGAYFLMAGLAGIPAGEWLDWLIETLFGVKPSAAFKSVLFKEYGDTPFTRTVAYGIGANVGVDISRRVGMANMIPDSASMWGYLFGPAGNITERIIRSAASQDYTKAIKALSPVMGNLAEAVIHGYSTNSKGQINYMYNDVEKVLKSMGFRTVGESMDSDLRTAVYLDKQSRKDDRQKVMMEMVKKRIDGEALTPEDYKALREQGITGAQFQKAVRAAKMTALQRTRAGMTKQQKKDFAGTIVMEDE